MDNIEVDGTMRPELLALLLRKDFWRKYKFKVVPEMFAKPVNILYKTISQFHDQNEEDDLDKVKLWEMIKIDHPVLTDAVRLDLYELTESIKDCNEWSEEFAEKVLTSVWKQEIFRQIAEVGVLGSQGKINNLEGLKDIVDRHSDGFIPKDNFVENTMDLEDLIADDDNLQKWDFGLEPLQDRLGGMSAGQFLQIMARPDAGKTAFLISAVCGPGGYASQGAKVDWYGNEEPIKRTRWRCISSHTGMTKGELEQNVSAANELWATIKQNVRTFDIPFGTPVEQIAVRTRDRRPDIVIVDQIDKLGVQPMAGNFVNETERLRILYVKFREIAKKYDCLVIGVCQASAEAEGKRIVTYDMAENSKTGKAAECDVFIGVGKSGLSDQHLTEDNTRYITVSKNKLDSGWKGTMSCLIQPRISRYVP